MNKSSSPRLTAALVFLGFLLLGCVLFLNKTVVYESTGWEKEILETNYDSCANCQKRGNEFIQTSEDPQIHFKDIEETYSGVVLRLARPLSQDREYQLYWGKEGAFREFDSRLGLAKRGQDVICIPVKKGQWDTLRFDMDGEFELTGLSLAETCKASYFLAREDLPKTAAGCLVIMAVYLAALAAHRYRSKGRADYLPSLLGRPSSKRNPAYDYLRVLALVMVVCTHLIQQDMPLLTDGRQIYFMKLLYTLCLGCNLIYFMISGALLLPYKEEKLSHFYIHRVTRVALPMILYYFFSMWNYIIQSESLGKGILLRFRELLSGNTPEAPHYWFFYELLCFYFIIPFFRYLFKEMSYLMLTKFAGVIVVLMAASTYIPLAAGRFALSGFINSWFGVVILGYWLSQKETRRYDRTLLMLGGASVILTALWIRQREDFLAYTTSTSPTMVLFCCALFALACHYQKKLSVKNAVINFLSKYSYSMILIHWWVMFHVIYARLDLHITSLQPLGLGVAAVLAATLGVCAGIAFVMDNLVIVPAETLVTGVLNFLATFCSRLKFPKIH